MGPLKKSSEAPKKLVETFASFPTSLSDFFVLELAVFSLFQKVVFSALRTCGGVDARRDPVRSSPVDVAAVGVGPRKGEYPLFY